MKICSVIITYNTPLYRKFDFFKRRYFESLKFDHDFLFVDNSTMPTSYDSVNKTYNYYCNHPPHPSGIPSMYNKFIHVIKSGILDEYDFVVRANSSTFVNMSVVRDNLADKTDNIYMGFFEEDWNFVSGACTIFSKDILQKLSNNSNLVDPVREDDVVIGMIMSRLNINKTYLDRACFSNHNPHDPDDIAIPSIEEIQQALKKPQIRIRNDSNREVKDIGIWSLIDQLVC